MNSKFIEAPREPIKMQTRRSSRVISPTESDKEEQEDIHSRRSHFDVLTKYEVADSKKRKQINKVDSQKEGKETAWTKKPHRDTFTKEKLKKLNKIEKEVNDGLHSHYHTLLSKVEEERANKLKTANIKREISKKSAYNFFIAQKESAISQYHWEKIALRRSMIKNVQYKLNKLEQEYYANHSNDIEKQNFSHWSPPEKPTMISPLALSLTSDESDQDLALASKKEYEI